MLLFDSYCTVPAYCVHERTEERQFFDARLRGRQLTGSRVYLPQSALGLVVQETVPAAGKSAAKAKAPVADDDGDAAMETKAPETRHWKVGARCGTW